jgi:hypothetical protein
MRVCLADEGYTAGTSVVTTNLEITRKISLRDHEHREAHAERESQPRD